MLNGKFGADDGATLQTALDALMRPPGRDDERSGSQRRADALVEMARRQLDAGVLPTVGGQKPHLLVTAELATLAKAPGARAAELEWAQRGGDGAADRLRLHADAGGRRRGPRLAQGDSGLEAAGVGGPRQDRFEGGDMPAAWTDAHHLRHWIDGGPDELWNLVLLCRRHHRLVHEGGLALAVPP